MEPILPPQPSTQSTPVQPVIPISQVPVQPRNNFLLVFIIIILLVALGATGYFAYQNYQLKQQITRIQPTPAGQSPLGGATPIPVTPIPTVDPTANWKTYTSACGFLMKYPEEWKAQKYFIEDKDTACAFLTSPDYKQGLDSRIGFWIEVTRFTKGTMNIGMNVNSIDDYLKSIEDSYKKSSTEPLPPLQTESKTYGIFQGTQFDLSEFESISTFIFSHDNYLWIIKWPTITQYNGSFRINLDQILSTFKFTNAQDDELLDVRKFVDEYAQTYMSSNWQKLKTLLTASAAADMTQNGTTMPANGSFTSYQIMSINKNPNPVGYKATIEFLQNGKPYYNIPNSQYNPSILIVKENGVWKSMTWYLYQ